MKYYCLDRSVGGKPKSTIVTTCNDGRTYETIVREKLLVAEFFIAGHVTEKVAQKLAFQYKQALEMCDEASEHVFSNTFLATRHP